MVFNSFHFLFFFVIVTVLYFTLPHKYRWLLLLSGSCYFYMAFIPVYILILGFTIIIDYFAGIYLEKSSPENKKLLLIGSILANVGVLAVFKYYNFINFNISSLLSQAGYNNPMPYLAILLPIGLSFHTFQAMSYTIEVYRGKQKAERHFGIYALYVMFYPQLVAGPIERPQNLLHQFYEKHSFDYARVTHGLKLMGWGLFKKVVIADRLASMVDVVYNNPSEYQGLALIMATVFFSFQIYCDFSGYSDMAIGAAEVMGFKLMKNFDRPYASKNIQEFWKRWHISLSTWFKDYLYISLGGNRVSIPRWYLNLFIVFLISGLWHGASWTFVIWGALHGCYLIFGLVTQNIRQRITHFLRLDKYTTVHKLLQTMTTFILVTFAWIFFRANSLSDALYIIKYSFTGLYMDLYNLLNRIPLDFNIGSERKIMIALASILFMEFIQKYQEKHKLSDWLTRQPSYIRFGVYYAFIIVLIFLGNNTSKQFIYFQF
ncbi:MAG TPA: MBOAT family O-acyltransferase [Prolixibacteraceae bacterium]|nr:MBOAT family O-acyltransferase [Prolixibacteraceae bacterium]